MWVETGGAGNAVLLNDQLERLGWEMDRLDVPVQPLDEVELPFPLAGRRCCVVKMDIEGAELEALNGGRKFFAEHRPVVLGEFNAFFMEKNRLEPNVVQIWADDNGYSCFEDPPRAQERALGPPPYRSAPSHALLVARHDFDFAPARAEGAPHPAEPGVGHAPRFIMGGAAGPGAAFRDAARFMERSARGRFPQSSEPEAAVLGERGLATRRRFDSR